MREKTAQKREKKWRKNELNLKRQACTEKQHNSSIEAAREVKRSFCTTVTASYSPIQFFFLFTLFVPD